MIEKLSYSSANAYPAKLLCHLHRFRETFFPMHLQLFLTNKCQLHCPYCSCSKRDKELSISFNLLEEYIKELRQLGLKAVTVTGGGEPLLYDRFEDVIDLLRYYGLKIGLVTNGIAIKQYPKILFQAMDWIRVSYDKYRGGIPDLHDGIRYAFSYVYHEGSFSDPGLHALIASAKINKITHLRIVSDILKEDSEKQYLGQVFYDMPDNVILQDRKEYTKGTKHCWVCMVKPVLDVDGVFYPCCGAQYAVKNNTRRMPLSLNMGDLDRFKENYLIPQVPFDGTVCYKCYYDKYNDTLETIKYMHNIKHQDFI